MKLELKELYKSYGKFEALKNVSLELTPGVYGLLGPNGAGKTTLIKAIVGVHAIDSGAILFNDTPVNDFFLKEIGFLPQAPTLYSNYTGRQFLEYMCVLKEIPKKDVQSTIDGLLMMVNLTDEKKKIKAYSGGMRQRLGIAQALIGNPSILILDEPTAGLDPEERLRFRNIISKLSKDKIILLATHIVSDIENIAKEIILLNHGEIIGTYAPEELLNSVSPYVWKVSGISSEEHERLDAKYRISNVKMIEDQFELRLLSEKRPHKNAKQIKANLEDVYLYTFQGEKV